MVKRAYAPATPVYIPAATCNCCIHHCDRPYYILPIVPTRASTLGQMPSGDLLCDGGPNVILLLSYIGSR